MTEKEFKKLNRYQLLELLILQTQRVEELEAQLSEAQEKLKAREIRVNQAGSMADAVLQLSGFFDSAQIAVDSYLSAAGVRAVEIEEEANEKAKEILEDAQAKADALLATAQKRIREKS